MPPRPFPALPSTAVDVIHAVAALGGRALVVGGWVRDAWLGLASKDVDLEVYGLAPETLRGALERLGSVNAVGESFTVFKVGDVDVALPRRESKIGRGHRGFEVVGDPHMDPREAARRRDFTINAVAWDPLDDRLHDAFDGLGDLDRRLLRMVDATTFGDDSLRVLRALQFAARFELAIDDTTAGVCRAIALDDLPRERVWGEVEKLLLRAARPSVGWQLGLDLGVVEQLFPECHALVGCQQEPEWHPEGDVWVHTLMVVDQMRMRIDDLPHPQQCTLMLAAVAHDFGKPSTTAFSDGRIRSLGHEEAGVAPADAFLDRLLVNTLDGYDVRGQVCGLVAHHLKPGAWYKAPQAVGDGAFRRLALKVDLELLARLSDADCQGRTGTFDCGAGAWFLERARALGVQHDGPPSLLLGRHVLALGLTPGPRVGEVLKHVYERQLDGEVTTLDEAIAAARHFLGI